MALLTAGNLWAASPTTTTPATSSATRPNIVWISCEDISPNLGCYGDPHADTPHLDRLAGQGVRFTHAFTPAGVCAVVRSSLITGRHAPSIGSQHMRSQIAPPEGVVCFTEYLRMQGYFCTNRSKTDYQFDPPVTAWDRQGNNHRDWRERPTPDTPFFSVINLTVSHESQIRHSEKAHQDVAKAIGAERLHDPDQVVDTMPPYFPDTPNSRRDWAWYQDNITRMDQMAGEILERLEEDGLAESTLVIFWSDHGMGLPRGKRWLYDSGTHVPMIARWPNHIEAGTVNEELVSVLDLPPTLLSLAGIRVPEDFQGRVLWGPESQPEPAYLFFHRDRMDEAYDMQRAARDRRWKYIRNYEPEKPYAQGLDYMDQMPTMRDWRKAAAEGTLTAAQKPWMAATKPIEELYDTETDPWELVNLAEDPQYSDRLARMREATETWEISIGDLGFIPEPVLMFEMFSGHEIPSTEPPVLTRRGSVVTLSTPTNGATITFRTKLLDEWSPWQIYRGPFEVAEGAKIEARAIRTGYKPSQTKGS